VSKRHDAVFDDVLSGLDDPSDEGQARFEARFLKRSTALAEQSSGFRQEKVLRSVQPESCIMWEGHNRAYDLLTEENCRDLIDGILSQGQQEFPAIVRRIAEPKTSATWEVICGARRHFAISWLRANNYPQFRYLIEERELTDEEAFRLADIENRDREDISDYERAKDYLHAVGAYYQGNQSMMAERLQVSPGWLSRYLGLARLEGAVVAAFASIRDLKELHARILKPLMASAEARSAVLAEADALAAEQAAARAGQGAAIPAAQVMARLKAAATPPKARKAADAHYRGPGQAEGVQMRRKGQRVLLEFDRGLSDDAVRAAVEAFLSDRAAR
jgi:ParB family chromosome partitioning protein